MGQDLSAWNSRAGFNLRLPPVISWYNTLFFSDQLVLSVPQLYCTTERSRCTYFSLESEEKKNTNISTTKI